MMRQRRRPRPDDAAAAPTIAALVAVWCGAQNGGSVTSGRSGRSAPATE